MLSEELKQLKKEYILAMKEGVDAKPDPNDPLERIDFAKYLRKLDSAWFAWNKAKDLKEA